MIVCIELADYLPVAERVLGLPAELTADFDRIGLAESALAAPQAGFGGVEACPDETDRVIRAIASGMSEAGSSASGSPGAAGQEVSGAAVWNPPTARRQAGRRRWQRRAVSYGARRCQVPMPEDVDTSAGIEATTI